MHGIGSTSSTSLMMVLPVRQGWSHNQRPGEDASGVVLPSKNTGVGDVIGPLRSVKITGSSACRAFWYSSVRIVRCNTGSEMSWNFCGITGGGAGRSSRARPPGCVEYKSKHRAAKWRRRREHLPDANGHSSLPMMSEGLGPLVQGGRALQGEGYPAVRFLLVVVVLHLHPRRSQSSLEK